MKTENKVLMAQARESLKGKWWMAVGGFGLYLLINIFLGVTRNFGVLARDLGALISLLISGPLAVGIAFFSLSLSRNKEVKVSQIFDGFNKFWRSCKAGLLVALFTLLWSLLLLVPGIVASLSYTLTFYILAEDNSVTASEAIKKSKKMMYGYKWKFFCLGFRFFGWILLSILTLGIGFFWLFPYTQVSMAKFYDDVSEKIISPTN